MNHQACRFIQDGQIIVLENNGERNGCGLDGAWRLLIREMDSENLTSRDQAGSTRGFSPDGNQLVCDEAGGLRAGDGQLIG
jgi:hypothetical protein